MCQDLISSPAKYVYLLEELMNEINSMSIDFKTHSYPTRDVQFGIYQIVLSQKYVTALEVRLMYIIIILYLLH